MTVIHTNNDAENTIVVSTTSNLTADASTIELRDSTDKTRLVFEPTLVNNWKEPDNSVEGTLIYERKAQTDPLFPSQKNGDFTSKIDIKKDDALKIHLSSSETKKLYLGLQKMYKLHADVHQFPNGESTYIEANSKYSIFKKLLQDSDLTDQMIADNDTSEILKNLLKFIAKTDLTKVNSLDKLKQIFADLENGDLSEMSTGINLEMLERTVADIKDNMFNEKEEYWQKMILEAHPWIISQLFSAPYIIFESKAYVGGKSIQNSRGSIADFLYQNEMTKNIAIIEIKTPKTPLLDNNAYRERSYAISKDLSGAINQVLSYRHLLVSNSPTLKSTSEAPFEAFSPQCIVIAGHTNQFLDPNGNAKQDAIGSFENFRNALNGVIIITFDELLKKVENLLAFLRQPIPLTNYSENSNLVDSYSDQSEVEEF